jgi:hypothetical protein
MDEERNRWGQTRGTAERMLAAAEAQLLRVREETDHLADEEWAKERADRSYRSPILKRRIEAAAALNRARLMVDDFDGKNEEAWDAPR